MRNAAQEILKEIEELRDAQGGTAGRDDVRPMQEWVDSINLRTEALLFTPAKVNVPARNRSLLQEIAVLAVSGIEAIDRDTERAKIASIERNAIVV